MSAEPKKEMGELLVLLSDGHRLGMPHSCPMPIIEPGIHELRIRSREGNYRVFYFTGHPEKIMVFHVFKKKNQKTPVLQISVARRRLGEMLHAQER